MTPHGTTTTEQRDAIVAVARSWLGTPYRHQASFRGVGCDCLGLIRGVYASLYGREPEPTPAYSRDWAEAAGEETLLQAARRHLVLIDIGSASAGDVLIYRYRPRLPAKHCAILTGSGTMIHAVEGAAVAEVVVSSWWRRRMAGAFAFPGVSD